ncbi:MAG: FAD-binding protein [Eggerthellaceae bacterium]
MHLCGSAGRRAAILGADIQEAVDKAVELAIDHRRYAGRSGRSVEIPAEALKETVARYNELAEAGVDEDYGKPAADLGPIAQGPFHIVRVYTPMDVTMGGLMVNGNMQVLDEDDAVIEGLYATGNTQGGFYGATDYDLEVDGFSWGEPLRPPRGEHAAR